MKRITIIELSSFLAQVGKTISRAERDKLIEYISKYPDSGDEIPRTSGIRKLRWAKSGKGKRGGYRVIYYFYNRPRSSTKT